MEGIGNKGRGMREEGKSTGNGKRREILAAKNVLLRALVSCG